MDDSLAKSLGVFAAGFVTILLVFLFYFSIKYCKCCGKCCGKIKDMLHKKLFWSGPLRYVIVGYLSLLGDNASRLLFKEMSVYEQVILSSLVLLLVVFPIWAAFFLTRNQDKLVEESFKQRFETLY